MTDNDNTDTENTVESLRDYYDDLDADLPWSRQDTHRWGARAGDAIAAAIRSTVTNLLLLLTRFVPFTGRFWKGLAKASLYNFYRRSGGDRIGLNHLPTGKIRLEPVKWDPAADELDEQPGYRAKGRDKVWTAGADGRADTMLGKTPIALLDEDHPEKGSMIESRVMEAIELDQDQRLYTDPVIQKIEVETPEPGMDPGQAIADGGANMTRYELRDEGHLEDVLVDLSTADGAAGQMVSFDRFTDKYEERATSERMRMAETRGYLAGLDPGAKRDFLFKIFLIAGLVAIAGLVGPEIVNALLGSGGGGGSVVPG